MRRPPRTPRRPYIGRAPGRVTAHVTTRVSRKLRFHNFAKPESRSRAPISENPTSLDAKLSPTSPWRIFTHICCTTSTLIQRNKSNSSMTIGRRSTDIRRESASVAKNSSQTHGPMTAVPAIEGEERTTANPDKPSQMKA